jgi:hypothetical protein
MFSTGSGGGLDLSMPDNPLQALIMLLVLVGITWIMFRLFSS